MIALAVPRQRWTAPDPKRPRIEPAQRLLPHGGNPVVDAVGTIATDGSVDELRVRLHDARDGMASFDREVHQLLDRAGSTAWPARLFMVPIPQDQST